MPSVDHYSLEFQVVGGGNIVGFNTLDEALAEVDDIDRWFKVNHGPDARGDGEARKRWYVVYDDDSEWYGPWHPTSEPMDLLPFPVQVENMIEYVDLHIDSRYVTKQLTTEQKNLWADMVDAGARRQDKTESWNDPRIFDRWWDR